MTHPVDENERQQNDNHIETNIGLEAKEMISNCFDVRCNEHHINATGAQLVNQQECVGYVTAIMCLT